MFRITQSGTVVGDAPTRFDAIQTARTVAPASVVEYDPVTGLGITVAQVGSEGTVLVQQDDGGWAPLHDPEVAADPFAGLGGDL